MSRSFDDLLSQGVLLALNREEAKQLFAAREPTALRQFLGTHLSNQPPVNEEADASFAVCDDQWPQIQHVLAQCEVADDSMQPALRQCLTGGRILCDSEDLTVWLVRPDMVPHVANALQSLDAEVVRQRLAATVSSSNGSDDSALTPAAATLGRILTFYQRAADNQAAVVFVARREANPDAPPTA